MYIELLINPSVIGAIIGTITSATFALVTSEYRFNKRKKGAKALIKSELNYIINSLEEFIDKHLKDELFGDNNTWKKKNFYYFYEIISNFPKLNNKNWINLITFIPSIFDEEEINKINQFYAKIEEISNNAKNFADEILVFIDQKEQYDAIICHYSQFKIFNNHRIMFRNDLNELIIVGEEAKKIFE